METASEQANLLLVQTVYEAALRGELGGLRELFDPQVAIHQAQSLPYGGAYRGPEAFAQAAAAFAQTWAEPEIRAEQFLCGGDRVAILVSISARHRPSGKPFSTMLLELWRLRDGRVVEVLPFYWDTGAIAALAATNHYDRQPAS